MKSLTDTHLFVIFELSFVSYLSGCETNLALAVFLVASEVTLVGVRVSIDVNAITTFLVLLNATLVLVTIPILDDSFLGLHAVIVE